MRICINALSARQGGGQTYLKNILRHLPDDGSIEVLLIGAASFELGFDHPYIEQRKLTQRLENPFMRAVWERVAFPRLARDFGADVVFCPGGVVNGAPRECQVVTMFRNMIPFDMAQRRRYPLGYGRIRNWLLRWVLLRSMLHADLVIFISAYARGVIERNAEGRTLRSVIIPHGIASQFRHPPVDSERGWTFSDTPYLLYVSYLDFYKAQIEVVRAYALLKAERITREKLLLVGPENPLYGKLVRAEISAQGLEGDVIVTGPVPYEALPHVYRGATVSIFASESENCPNILLEALAVGRPVVCSDRQPMPEFAGDAVLYFDPASPSDLAAKLVSLLDDAQAMDELAALGRSRSQRYDWERAARDTWDAITSLETLQQTSTQPRSMKESA